MKPSKYLTSENRFARKCRINGLRLTESSIEEVDGQVEYDFEDLDLLLISHRDKVCAKLYDDLFFEVSTIDVIEFNGKPYAIEKA